jgi:hypothetical protein
VINDFTVSDFGKLYRACGNCKVSNERHVVMKGVSATNGEILAGKFPHPSLHFIAVLTHLRYQL